MANGIRETAKAFMCSRNTVRLWVRRYKKEGLDGLFERKKIPRMIPHKTPSYLEEMVVLARQKVPCYGAKRLKVMFSLKPSIGAIGRILREKGLTRKQRKKYKKKRDLREIKAKYKVLTHHQVDVKHSMIFPIIGHK